jgi:hypothetical protein
MAAETVYEFDYRSKGDGGNTHLARACGRPRADGEWEGWIGLESEDGKLVHRTPREATQPNRQDLVYGGRVSRRCSALARAFEPPPPVTVRIPTPSAFDGPAEDVQVVVDDGTAEASEPVLDPSFS